MPGSTSTDNEPLYCDLSALEDPEAHKQESRLLFEKVEAVEELEDGFALRYAPAEGLAQRIGRFIEGERQCCPFFRFEMEVEPRGGPVWLRLRGSTRIKDFLDVSLISTLTS